MKRKEVELDAHGLLLEHRIQAYVEVYRLMQQNQKVAIVPFVEEQLYAACLEGSCYKNIHRGMEYPSYLSSVSRIKQYMDKLEGLLLTKGLYLEPKMRNELENLQMWVADIARLLRAFSATENDPTWSLDATTRRDNERFACSLLAIALQADVQCFYNNINPILEDKLRHPKLSRWRFEDSNINSDHSYRHSQLAKNACDLVVRLMFLHYRNLYSPDDYAAMPKEQSSKLMERFYEVFKRNLTCS